ncbi:hypothetical protein TNCV_50951 [Trichonephila clavipes]|nr:hypothetical protein TNCV_50951 [Trichonephila clavipes]
MSNTISELSAVPSVVGCSHHPYWGSGISVVKVSDHGRHVKSSSPIQLKTRSVIKRCTLNLPRTQTSSSLCGVVVWRGVPTQVSSSSFDHGSK